MSEKAEKFKKAEEKVKGMTPKPTPPPPPYTGREERQRER
jgi:hypothetical protein